MTAITRAAERGHALTIAPAATRTSHQREGAQEMLCFRVGAEQYGVDILDVQEIRSYEAPTRLFGAPADTLGVLDLRGTIVPLMDGRVRLRAQAGFDASTVTIVFNIDGRRVGLVVDQVTGVQRLAQDSIRPAPSLGEGTARMGVTGLTSNGDGSLVILLDARVLVGALN